MGLLRKQLASAHFAPCDSCVLAPVPNGRGFSWLLF